MAENTINIDPPYTYWPYAPSPYQPLYGWEWQRWNSLTAIPTACCEHCGMAHASGGMCPKIKAIDYYEDGTIKRVEYRDPYPETRWSKW